MFEDLKSEGPWEPLNNKGRPEISNLKSYTEETKGVAGKEVREAKYLLCSLLKNPRKGLGGEE